MKNEKCPNRAVHCTVEDCRFHCGKENFCGLKEILVATHEASPTDEKCVDCKSFECKSGAPDLDLF